MKLAIVILNVVILILHVNGGNFDFKTNCLDRSKVSSVRSTYFNGFCYIMHFESSDWTTANSVCTKGYKHGRLASISNKDQFLAIKSVLPLSSYPWSGLVRDQSKAEPIGWQYSNGHSNFIPIKSQFDLWATAQPKNGSGNFAVISNYGYYNEKIESTRDFICQFPEPMARHVRYKQYKFGSRARNQGASIGNISAVYAGQCSTGCSERPNCRAFAWSEAMSLCYWYWMQSDALRLMNDKTYRMFDKLPKDTNCSKPADCFQVCPPIDTTGGYATYYGYKYPDGSVENNTRVEQRCHSNKRYVKNGTTVASKSVQSTCNVPKWTKADVICKPVCNEFCINGLVNYEIQYSDKSIANDSNVTVQCSDGKRLHIDRVDTNSDSLTASCINSNWNLNNVRCGKMMIIIFTSTKKIEAFYPDQLCANKRLNTYTDYRHYAVVGLVGTKAVLTSGYYPSGNDYIRSTIYYNYVTNTLSTGPLITPRRKTAATVLKNIMYVCGGYKDVYQTSCVKLQNGLWKNMAGMRAKRAGFCMTGFGTNWVYAFGGYDGKHLNSAEKYKVSTNSWSYIAPMPITRHHCGVTPFNNNIYVCGGLVGPFTHTSQCHRYNTISNKWYSIADMKSNPSWDYHFLFEYENYLIMVHRYTAEIYFPNNNTWIIIPSYRSSGSVIGAVMVK